jgi:hypothetical protein
VGLLLFVVVTRSPCNELVVFLSFFFFFVFIFFGLVLCAFGTANSNTFAFGLLCGPCD